MYIFSLMGMQFFAGKLKFNSADQPDSNGRSIRYNFDTFPRAFLSVFILLTGENWNEMMYDAMRATSNFASLYFIVVIVLGNFIIVQLLVAIVINNFDNSRILTQKRKIIDEIEANIELGHTIIQSIEIVLGKDIEIDEENDYARGNSFKLFKKFSMRRKKTISKFQFFIILSKNKNNYIDNIEPKKLEDEEESKKSSKFCNSKIQEKHDINDIK